MSKNIVIQEGGIGKQLTVDKLKTDLVGGGTCLWVPEDERALTTKNITEDGTYKASTDGYYGYSEVTVSGIGTVKGKDSDGDDAEASVDPETGEIVVKKVPASIRITTLPTKTTYNYGETIDYSGIVVHAYTSTGTDMGEIPFNQLVFPATKALGGGEGWTDGQGLNARQITYMPSAGMDNYGHEVTVYVGPVLGSSGGNPATYGTYESPGTSLLTRYNGENYGLWKSGSKHKDLFVKRMIEDFGLLWIVAGGTSGYSGQGQFERASFDNYLTDIPTSTVNPTTVDPSNLHATQSIPVQWPSRDAGETLETSFTIEVQGGTT